MATEVERARRLFTIGEYDRMVEMGIIARDERVELIDGEIVEMSPIGNRHAACLSNLHRLYVFGVGNRAVVWQQGPLRIPPRSKPQPDLALLRPRSYQAVAPSIKDVLLVAEVSDTSLAFDRSTKLRLYARARIPEYWITNTKGFSVEVYRTPGGDAYRDRLVFQRGDTIAPLAFPDIVIPVAEIFA